MGVLFLVDSKDVHNSVKTFRTNFELIPIAMFLM
ncbi:hypothetical protein FB550_103183 [Neobacillus bataviensis]|uniref:Uncharacterized protein n=1 Tax=Neobacillus bataviensis TaxID=220685 RepID=A0A561DNS7_9BACI|nr:hypothetical protein FB550_103183 [Neobacillus bataviensis]